MPTIDRPRKKRNLAVYNTDDCPRCAGGGKEIDHVLTGTRAKRERERAGLTQEVVAKAMGITGPYLSDLERGTRPWSPALLESLASALEPKAVPV